MKQVAFFIFVLSHLVGAAFGAREGSYRRATADSIVIPRIFINTGFENASPMNWRIDSAGRVIGQKIGSSATN